MMVLRARNESTGVMSKFKSEMTGGWKSVALGAGIAGAAMAGASAVIADKSIKAASAFQSQMLMVHTQAGASMQEVHNLGNELVALGPKVAEGPTTLAEGLYHVESAGFRGAAALKMVKAAAEGAQIGDANLEDVTNALIAATASHIKGIHGSTQAMGILNKIVGIGNMRMQDLASAMGTGILASAHVFGLSITDVGAALATLTDNAMSANSASTKMRMVISMMGAPTKKAQGALADLGLGSTKLADDMRQHGLLYALQDLKTHLKDTGDTASQQTAIMSSIFGGGRTSSAAMVLLSQLDRVKEKYHELGGVTKSALGDSFQKWLQSAHGQMEQLHASISAIGIAIGSALLPILQRLTAAILPIVQKIAGWVQQHKTLAAIILASVFVIGTLTVAVVALSFAFSALSGPIGITVLALTALTAGVGYLLLANDSWTNANKQTIQSETDLTNAMQGEKDAAHQLVTSRQQLAGDKNAIADAKLALERDKVALATTHAAKGSLDYRTLLQQVRDGYQGVNQAEQQHKDNLASVADSTRKAAQASREQKTSLEKTALSLQFQTAMGSLTNKNSNDYAKALHAQANEFQNTNPLLSHNLDMLAKYATSVGDLKNMQFPVIKAIVDNTDAKKRINEIKGYGTSTPDEGQKPKSQGPFYEKWWQDIQDIYHHATNKISQMLETAWARIREKVEYYWDLIRSTFWNYWNKIMDDAQSWGSSLLSYFTGLWGDCASNVSTGWGTAQSWFTGLGSTIEGWVGSAANWLWQQGVDAIRGIWNGLVSAYNWTMTQFSTLGNTIAGWVTGAASWLESKGTDAIHGIWNGIVDGYNWTKGKFAGLGDTISGWVTGASSWLSSKGSDAIHGLWTGAQSAWGKAKKWFGDFDGMIGQYFKSAKTWLEDTGVNIMQGLWNGLKSKWDDVKKWFGGLKGWIDSHMSPVSVDQALLQPSGVAMMQGLSIGLASQIPNLQSTLSTVKSTIVGSGSSSLGSMSSGGVSLGGGSGGAGITFNITGNMLTDGPAIDLLTNKIGAKLATFGVPSAGIALRR